MSARHDWNSWDHYQAIHLRRINDYLDHFILSDRLRITQTRTVVRWDGVLYCVDGLEIHVTKLQDADLRAGRLWVRTRKYSYHVLQRVGRQVVNLFRYDNVHQQPGHPDAHHRHRFDAYGREIEPPEHIGETGWPTLGDILDEAHRWWVTWIERKGRT